MLGKLKSETEILSDPCYRTTPDAYCADRHHIMAHWITGRRSFPCDFPCNSLGLKQYLESMGITHFGPKALITTNRQDLLRDSEAFIDPVLGRVVMPSRWAWPRLVCILAILEVCRSIDNKPIFERYWYRPPLFNRAITRSKANPKGTALSDHVTACAVDVDFSSRDQCLRALASVIWPRWQIDEYGLSVGWDSERSARLHLGVWAPETIKKGRPRQWDYAKLRKLRG